MEYSTRGQYSTIRNYVSNYSLLDNHKFSNVTFPYNGGNNRGDNGGNNRGDNERGNAFSNIIIPDFKALDVMNNNMNNSMNNNTNNSMNNNMNNTSLHANKPYIYPSNTICGSNSSSSCSIGNVNSYKFSNQVSSSDQNLLPILDPVFNLKEASKHLILLEDHLFQKGRRCKDCIIKHIYTIEAFLEEAITLDTTGENVKLIEDVHSEFKTISKEIIDIINNTSQTDEDIRPYIHSVAQKLRNLRKPLMHKTITLRE
jgi:hypothetical protein